MIVNRSDEKLLHKYVRDIMKAESKDKLKIIDNIITYDDDVSVRGYAILMDVIKIKEETL